MDKSVVGNCRNNSGSEVWILRNRHIGRRWSDVRSWLDQHDAAPLAIRRVDGVAGVPRRGHHDLAGAQSMAALLLLLHGLHAAGRNPGSNDATSIGTRSVETRTTGCSRRSGVGAIDGPGVGGHGAT